jgi:hypothetical protein
MAETQNYKNHTRWYPPFHFVLAPLMLANLVYWIVRFYQNPGWDNGELVILGAALILLMFVARLFALRCQDRLVRLEERIRYEKLLSPDMAAKASDLRVGQIIALRFASDEELPGLIERTLNGEFGSQKEIKLAVKNWRPDYFRV